MALGLAVDTAGNLFVADFVGNQVRMVTPQGVISTLAGNNALSGMHDGVGVHATFSGPWGIAVGADGTLYISDRNNHSIRKATPVR